MNLYGGPIEQNFNEDYNRRKNSDPESTARSAKNHAKKQEKWDPALAEDQIRHIRDNYDLICMSEEQEEAFLQDLIKMGILSKRECDAYAKNGGNLFEEVSNQINLNIRRLYQLAIAGKDSDFQVEQIRSLQKMFNVLEQVKD